MLNTNSCGSIIVFLLFYLVLQRIGTPIYTEIIQNIFPYTNKIEIHVSATHVQNTRQRLETPNLNLDVVNEIFDINSGKSESRT